jgi:hypothetical protein
MGGRTFAAPDKPLSSRQLSLFLRCSRIPSLNGMLQSVFCSTSKTQTEAGRHFLTTVKKHLAFQGWPCMPSTATESEELLLTEPSLGYCVREARKRLGRGDGSFRFSIAVSVSIPASLVGRGCTELLAGSFQLRIHCLL